MLRDVIILLGIGSVLVVHGGTILALVNMLRLYIDFGILGRHEIPLSRFPEIINVVIYSWSMITIGIAVIIAGYIIHQIRKHTHVSTTH